MSMEQRYNLKEYKEQYIKMIQIGKIVSVIDSEHPEYMEELFMVKGFQQDIVGQELIVAVMDHKYKTFLVQVDNIILKSLFTIDDMFPPRSIILQPMSVRI